MHPSNAKRGKESAYGGRDIFNEHKIPYDKFLVYEQLDRILVDFEDYMACARIGGTNSLALDEDARDADEDIRGTLVQNVSINLHSYNLFSYSS